MRRVVRDLNTIWDQPGDPMNVRRPDHPTYRDATILWLAFQRSINPDGSDSAGVHVYPVDEQDLVSRLTTGDADGSGITESGIAIPIARIIADLEQATGDVLDFDEHVRKVAQRAAAEIIKLAEKKDEGGE